MFEEQQQEQLCIERLKRKERRAGTELSIGRRPASGEWHRIADALYGTWALIYNQGFGITGGALDPWPGHCDEISSKTLHYHNVSQHRRMNVLSDFTVSWVKPHKRLTSYRKREQKM